MRVWLLLLLMIRENIIGAVAGMCSAAMILLCTSADAAASNEQLQQPV